VAIEELQVERETVKRLHHLYLHLVSLKSIKASADAFLRWIHTNRHRHERSLIQVWPVRRRRYASSSMIHYHVCVTACRGTQA